VIYKVILITIIFSTVSNFYFAEEKYDFIEEDYEVIKPKSRVGGTIGSQDPYLFLF
jgi:hypothetical protein